MTIILYGRIPSKKNSTWTLVVKGRSVRLPSAEYKKWHKVASSQLVGTRKFVSGDRKSVSITFYAPDKRKTDLTNKAESVMDLLVDNGVLEDDNWECVPRLLLSLGGIDRENPRAEINIINYEKDH